MEKFGVFKTVFLCFVIFMLSAFGLTACGDPREGMKIDIRAVGDTALTEVDGRLSVSLVMGYDSESKLTETAQAKIVATVSGGDDSVSRRVEAISSDSSKITCVENVYNDDLKTSTLTLQGLSPTYDENNIYVDIVCSETSAIFKRIYIKIELPAIAVEAKSGTDVAGSEDVLYYGVPANTVISLDPYKLFAFTPAMATVPKLTYVVAEQSYESLLNIQIPERTEIIDGYLPLTVYSTDDPENEDMQATVYLRVYEEIDAETVNLSREDLLASHGQPINQLELIKNQTVLGANEALIQINYESNGVDELLFDFSVAAGVLNNILAINNNPEMPNQFYLRGATLCTDGVFVTFSITFKGISNSPVYTTQMKVFVVDYPKGVTINGTTGESLYVANVYDSYSGTTKGTPVTIGLTQFSESKGAYRLEVVTDGGESYLTSEEVLSAVEIKIQGQNTAHYLSEWDDGEGLKYESGQILLFNLKNSEIVGRVLLRVVSVAVDENDLFEGSVTRNFAISLGKGVTDINLSSTAMDQNTKFVYLQIDTYAIHGNYLTKTINFDVLPAAANKFDMVVRSSNESVFTTEPVSSTGSFNIRAVAPGVAQIIMTAGSGYTERFDVQVLNVLGGISSDINVTEQSDIVAESSFENILLNEQDESTSVRTIKSITASQGKPVFITLNCYPNNANFVNINAESENTSIVSITRTSFTQLVLTTINAGTTNVNITISYDRVNDAGNALYMNGSEKEKRTLSFEVVVYAPITSFDVSSNFVEMYLKNSSSVYDAEKCEITINAIVNPQYSTVKANATRWTLLGTNLNESWVLLNGQRTATATGSSLTISTVERQSGNASAVTVYLIASIQDKNQTKMQKITLQIKNLVTVTKLNSVEYDQSSGGYYFEESKGFSDPENETHPQSLEVKTVLTGNNNETPSNTNLEYFLFDAEKTSGIYTPKIDPSKLALQLAGKFCDTAFLTYNEQTKTYSIVPRSAGYAVLYVVPQSIMTFYASAVATSGIGLLEDLYSLNRTKMLKLNITVADGYNDPYRIYTAEDFVAIGSLGGLDKKYQLRNSIDFTSYFTNLYNNGGTWSPIGTRENPFTGEITAYGTSSSPYGSQNLVLSGFILRKDNFEEDEENATDNFGLFGVVSQDAYIKGITFDFSIVEYKNNQTNFDQTYYGVLAGVFNGTLASVNVNVSSLSIAGNSSKTMYTGLVGYSAMEQSGTHSESCFNKVNVTYDSVVIEGGDSLDVAFGGLVGHNMGIVTDKTSSTKNTVNLNLQVVNMSRNSSTNVVGAAVAKNGALGDASTQAKYELKNISTTGKIDGNGSFATGGICGINNGLIKSCVSSVQIWDSFNVGGVVGYSQTTQTLEDCYYEAFNTSDGKPNLYKSEKLSGETAIGGLVGRMAAASASRVSYSGTAEFCYVKSFADEGFVNISAQGTMVYVGGLYGIINNTGLGGDGIAFDVAHCFVELNIYIGAGSEIRSTYAGGLVGFLTNISGNSLTMGVVTTYVLGQINSLGCSLGLLFGNVSNSSVAPYDIYVALTANQGGTLTHRVIVGGTLNLQYAYDNTCYVIVRADETPTLKNTASDPMYEGQIVYVPLEKMQYNKLESGTYYLNSDSWKFLEENNFTNKGLPLIIVNGDEVLYPVIPTYFECENPFVIVNYNSTNKNIVQTQKITDLFNIIIGPEGVGLNAENTAVSIVSSNPNAISIVSGVYLSDFYIDIKSTGTTILTITSTRNPNVSVQVEVCAVTEIDEFYAFKSEDDAFVYDDGAYIESDEKAFAFGNDGNEIEIKLGQSLEFFVRYYHQFNILQSINGGVAIVTNKPDALSFGGAEFKPYDEDAGTYIVYLENARNISVETLKVQSDILVEMYVYVTGSFIDFATGQLFNTREILSFELLKINISIVNGASNMEVTLGGNENEPNTIEAKDDFIFDVNLTTDSQKDKTAGANVVVEYYDETSNEWLTVYDLTLNTLTGVVNFNYYSFNADTMWNEKIIIIFNSSTVTETVFGFSQWFEFYLQDNFIRELSSAMRFRAHFSSFYTLATDFPNNGNAIYTEKDVYWTVLPQGVDYLEITHFSDAESSGNYLINAGQKPTNTIIAGEYGLLNISISPDYAIYDTVYVTSSITNNDSISFDQRVLVETTENADGTTTTKFLPYETDVYLIDGGISVAKVSTLNESTGKTEFDGNLWIRTVVSNTLDIGTTFDVTVTILRQGIVIIRKAITVEVDKVVDIELGFYSYHESLGSFVAAGTGGSQQSSYSKNEVVVTTLGTVNSLKVNIFDDTSNVGVSIERRNERYYVVLPTTNLENQLGKTFGVQAVATKIINGMPRTVTKSMRFTIVNFVLAENLQVENALNGNYVAVYIPNEKYNLNVVEDYTKFSYNKKFEADIESFFAKINAKADNVNDIVNAWQYRQSNGYYTAVPYFNSLVDNDVTSNFIINGNYYIEWISNEVSDTNYSTGFKIVPLKYGQTESLIFDLTYNYTNGKLVYDNSDDLHFERMTTINLSFVQRSSIENPIPVYTKTEFLNMEPSKHYILMENLNFSDTYWTPMTTAIASLNGNGKTVTIGNFNVSGTNFGFFGTISNVSVIKNLTVCYAAISTISLDASELKGFNFGGFAAENQGVISNCAVVRAVNGNVYPAYKIENSGGEANSNEQNIAGFVASNLGDISNSRVENFSITVNWGHLSGFCVSNTGTIASSYYAGNSETPTAVEQMAGTLINNANIPNANLITTTGFVTYNEGTISGSYVGGAFTTADEQGKISLSTSAGGQTLTGPTSRDARIYCSYYASGFIYENNGYVYDSYSGIYINCGNDCCGFVYNNLNSGFVVRCYSVSLLSQSSNSQTPFIGTTRMGTDNIKVNNNNQSENAFENCFFYDFGCPDIVLKNEVAKALSVAQFINQDGAELSAWQYYSVSRMSNSADGQEFTGVWTFVQQNNEYFNTKTFTKNFGPQLVSANVIARANPFDTVANGLMQRLDNEKTSYDEETGETIYCYAYNVANNVQVGVNPNTQKSYTYFEPFVITSAVDLNKLLVNSNDASASNDSWFRLACDINLAEVKEGTDGSLNTTSTLFAGNFEGNLHTIDEIEIVSESQSGNDNNIKSENVGLVAKIFSKQNSTSLGTVKNLNLKLNDISATLVVNVGTLAGAAENAYLFNIDVSGDGSIVIGRNNVGGVVGKLTGTSRVNNISASVSVRAVFGSPDQASDPNVKKGLIYNEDLWRMFVYENDISETDYATLIKQTNLNIITKDQYLAYIGGLFGIVDVVPFEGATNVDGFNFNSALVSNLKATGNVAVIGGTVGGIAGFVGSSSVINLASKEVLSNSYLNSTVFAGGLVGENHGYIRYSEITYNKEIQSAVNSANIGEDITSANINFFRGSSLAIGGLVGFNYGLTLEGIQTGNIYSSNSRINVVNKSASIAGGAVGISIGGSSTATLTTGNVRAMQRSYIGGLFGAVLSLQDAISFGETSVVGQTLLLNPYTLPDNLTSAEFVYFKDEIYEKTLKQQPALVTYSIAINNWAAKDYEYFVNILTDSSEIACMGGFAGYVSEHGDALTIIHSSLEPADGALDVAPENIEYSSETNFYVNKIYDRVLSKTNVAANNTPLSLAAGTRQATLAAVGSTVTYKDELGDGNITFDEQSGIVDYAKGLNRNYMQSPDGQKRMYGNWARYSFSRDENGDFVYDAYGSVTFDRDTVPDTVEIRSVGDIRSVMAWELNAKYILKNDIDCHNESFVLGQLDSPFTGKLDGNGYKVYNYNLKGTNALAVGFFAYTKGAEIVNLKLYNFNIVASNSTDSISQVGLLVGKAIDTKIDNVEIIEKLDEEEAKRSTITTNYMYVGSLVGYAYTDLTDMQSEYTRNFACVDLVVNPSSKQNMKVGGLFGFVEGAESETLSQDVRTYQPSEDVGWNRNNTIVLKNNGYTGNITVVTSSNGISVGGFAGHIKNATTAQNFAYANIDTKNLTDSTRSGVFAGGFAGKIDDSFVAKAVAGGELYVDTGVGMSDNRQPINIGGLAGYVSADVWTAFVSQNISFTSSSVWTLNAQTQNSITDYSVSTTSVNNKQNIGGFAGVWRVDHNNQYYNIISTSTMFNQTTLSRVDDWAFASDQEVASTKMFTSLVVDTYLSNVACNNFEMSGVKMVVSNKLVLGDSSTSGYGDCIQVTSGNEGKNSYYNSKNIGMYPGVAFLGTSREDDTTELTGTSFENYYQGIFINGTLIESGNKLKPVLLTTSEETSEAVKNSANGEYKFYFMQSDWNRSLIYLDTSEYDGENGANFYEEGVNENYDLYGFFYANSDAQIKQLTSYDFLFGNPNKYAVYTRTPKVGIFDDILDESRNSSAKKLPYGSVVSGVNITGVALSYASNATADVNIGLVACGEVQKNSFIFGCTTTGYVEYTYNNPNATVNIGGIASNVYGQINSCNSAIDIKTTGSATFNVGGLVANINSYNEGYPVFGISNSYFNGSILNNAQNAHIAGVVANVSGYKTHEGGELYARNSYTIGKITNNGGTNVVFNTFVADAEQLVNGDYTLETAQNPVLASVSGNLYYESTTIDSSKHTTELTGILPFATISHRASGGRNYVDYLNRFMDDGSITPTEESEDSLATKLGVGAWVSLDNYNYVYPVLAYTQVLNMEKISNQENGIIAQTGTGSEADPYLIQNEGSLVWALKENKQGYYYRLTSNFEYVKINDLIALLNLSLEDANKLSLTAFNLKGNIDGSGHSISGSTDVLVGTIASGGSVKSIKFTGIAGTDKTLLTNTNNGVVSDCYLDNTQTTNYLIKTNNNLIENSFTNGAQFTKSGTDKIKNSYKASDLTALNTYEKCMQNDKGMDFYRLWAFIPNNASATMSQENVTGAVGLRSFIDNWSNTDLSAYTFSEYQDDDVTVETDSRATTTISNLKITSVTSFAKIAQYIKRNSSLNFVFNATFNQNGEYDFEGKSIDPIGGTLRTASNADFILEGNNATIYNAYLDDKTTLGYAGLFNYLTTTSSIKNLNFNNVTANSEEYAGILAGVNESLSISDITVKNSWVVCNTSNAGALFGQNKGGSVEHCTVDNCYVDSFCGNAGGMIGLNTGSQQRQENSSFGSNLARNTVSNSAINKFASLKQLSATSNVGGFVGSNEILVVDGSYRALSFEGVNVENTTVQGFNNVGGVAGYSQTSISSVTVNYAGNMISTFKSGNDEATNIGGVVGFMDGELALSATTLNTPEIIGAEVSAGILAKTSQNVGGVAGKIVNGRVRTVQVFGGLNIAGKQHVGGIAGFATTAVLGQVANLISVTNTNITAEDTYVGGIVAKIDGTESEIDYATVSTCTISAQSDYAGGIAGQSNSTNVKLVFNQIVDSNISGGSYVGGFVGAGIGVIESYDSNTNSAKLENTKINATGDFVGGAVGHSMFDVVANVRLSKLTITATKSAVNYVGGAFGKAEGNNGASVEIQNVSIEGDLSNNSYLTASTGVTQYVGGFAGELGTNISVTKPTVRFLNLTANDKSIYVGGFVGKNSATTIDGGYTVVTGETNNGTTISVSGGTKWTGGIVGYNSSGSTITLAVYGISMPSSGDKAGKTEIGGVAGENVGTLETVLVTNTSTGFNLNADNNVGGCAGLNRGVIKNSVVTNATINAMHTFGGFVGQNAAGATVENSEFRTGSLTAYSNNSVLSAKVGGFVGQNLGTITESTTTNLGTITCNATTSYAHNGFLSDIGGFVGYNEASGVIQNANADANNVIGYENVGGLAGFNSGTIGGTGSVNGSVSGQGLVGGVVGYNDGTVRGYTSSVNITGRFCDGQYLYASSTATGTPYANGATGSTYILGGIVAYNSKTGKVENCKIDSQGSSNISLQGGSIIGGMIAVNAGVVTGVSTTKNIQIVASAATFFDTAVYKFTGNQSIELNNDKATNYVPSWLVINYTIDNDKKNSKYNIYGSTNTITGAADIVTTLGKYNGSVFASSASIMALSGLLSNYNGSACIALAYGSVVAIQVNPTLGNNFVNTGSRIEYTGTPTTTADSTNSNRVYQNADGVWTQLAGSSGGASYVAGNQTDQTPWVAGCVRKTA